MNHELKKILYAEDEEDIQVIAKIALEELGNLQVEFCNNGKEVLEKIDNYSPDLLILDVMMPGMDGPSALTQIRQMPQYEKLPAIFMTAKVQTNEIQKYNELNVIDVISKPFDPLTLADHIKKIWQIKVNNNETGY